MNAAEDKDAADHCAGLVRTHDFVRYASTLLVPAPERRALLALYAFNVEVTRVGEMVRAGTPRKPRSIGRSEIDAALEALEGRTSHFSSRELICALADHIAQFPSYSEVYLRAAELVQAGQASGPLE